MVNSQNNHWLALSPQDVPIVMKTKHPANITVFRMAINDSDVMPLFISSYGLNVKCLEAVVENNGNNNNLNKFNQ